MLLTTALASPAGTWLWAVVGKARRCEHEYHFISFQVVVHVGVEQREQLMISGGVEACSGDGIAWQGGSVLELAENRRVPASQPACLSCLYPAVRRQEGAG